MFVQVVIRGRKRFQSMRAEDVTVPTNAQIPSVNKIVIRKIDESIVTPSETNEYYVRGKKIFYGGLQTNYFYVSCSISYFITSNCALNIVQYCRAILYRE